MLPELTGNVFDLSADNQQAIVVKPRGRARAAALVGQPPAPGFAAVQPWVVSIQEPPGARARAGLEAAPELDDSLRATTARVGPCRGGQPEGVLFHDVTIGPRPWHPRRKRAAPVRPLARSRGTQRNVALSASGKLVVAAFEDNGRVLLALSTDGGARWKIRGTPLTGARQWWPSVSVRGNEVWLAAQVGDHVVWTHSTDGGRRFDNQHAVDSPAETWRPSIAATTAGRAYLAWIDTRERFTLDDLPQAGLYGAAASCRVRRSASTPPRRRTIWRRRSTTPGRRASPRAAAALIVTWIDFHSYDWDVRSRYSPTAAPRSRARRTR